MAEPRRSTFGPVVLVGLAAATLAAVASAQPWVSGHAGDFSTETSAAAAAFDDAGLREAPLAAALALVALAAWGVLLVTRGVVRRVVAGLALLAALGVLVVALATINDLKVDLGDALVAASGTDAAEVGITGWFAGAVAGAVLSSLAAVAAVRLSPTWPEMGRRYDAPTAEVPVGDRAGDRASDRADHRAGGAGDGEPEGNLDLWKAMDEGHDPTDPGRPLD